jgi:hypothetical protein
MLNDLSGLDTMIHREFVSVGRGQVIVNHDGRNEGQQKAGHLKDELGQMTRPRPNIHDPNPNAVPITKAIKETRLQQ